MRGSGRGGHRKADIRGQPCTACNEGVAHVVFWKQRNRFVFGCNASSAEKRCAGPKEWQSVDVPDDLRVDPSAASSAATSKGIAAGKREREAGDVGASAAAESSEEEAETSDKAVKREHN
jgi:hypothetical protein